MSSVFVRNLPFGVTQEEMEHVFSGIGPVKKIDVIKEKGKRKPLTSPLASLKRDKSSSWHLDAHVASSAAARGRADVKIYGRRTGAAIKSRRLSEKHEESCAQVDDSLVMLSDSVTPGRRVTAAPDSKAPFVISQHGRQNEMSGRPRSVFASGGDEHQDEFNSTAPLNASMPAIPAMPKVSPFMHERFPAGQRSGSPDISSIHNQELKSPILQKREKEEEKVPCELQDSEAPFVISPHRRQNEIIGKQRSVFACGGDEHQDKIKSTTPLNASMPAIPVMHKVRPFMHQRVPAGSPDMSPIRNQELKSPIMQKREIEEEKVPSNPALPSLLPSLEASGQ
ncbi:hypothetical protein PsorP6_010745 [Peronosclerospora sorghi]|uniref:Uncharacterized protein n=1 Tax=Peronosclerospora sorghi TaxID=230839 RepID=A0ACC0VX11_9STRA|nr:hypothetical protein PsorP6_010745 [Peronosclerospora sorghi]